MARFFTIIIVLCLFPLTVFGQDHTWQRTNPGGGGAFSTVGASASGIIIAGSDLSGAYRSIDGGQNWDVIGANKGLRETHVSGLGFHTSDGDMICIGTENGIFRSTDGGNSVERVLLGGYITDIAYAAGDNQVAYAAYHPTYDSNNGVVYKSIDNGHTWAQSSIDLPAGIRILKILVNPQNANTVYALTGQGRFACGPADLFRSLDGGVSWTNLSEGMTAILDAAIAPNDPDNIYVTTMNAACEEPYYWTDLEGSLYLSTDGGSNWGAPLYDQSGIILVSNAADTIRLIDPREPYPWIATAGTWTSTDGGLSFEQTGEVTTWDTFFNDDLFYCYSASYNGICKTIGKDLSDPNTFYWVNYQWIFKTTDSGATFSNSFTNEVSPAWWQSRGFDNVNMMDVAVSEADADIIYAAYFDIGLWRSLDKGQSWQSCNDTDYSGNWSGNGGNCASVLADPQRSHIVWATQSENQNGQAATYLLKSTNTGHKDSWNLSNTGLAEEEVMGLSIDENSALDNRTLFVTAQGDVYKSLDDGDSWQMVFDCDGCRFTAVDHFDAMLVYAGGEAGLWRSEDGGISWTDQSHNDMKTEQGFSFWDADYDAVFDVKTDPNHTDCVYVTALGADKGLFKSIDRGENWEKILTDDFMRKLAVVPHNSQLLYATSSSAFEAGGYDENSNGVWFSDDGGQTWTQQNEGMAYPFALAVAVDHTDAANVYVSSPGTGLQKALVPFISTTNTVSETTTIHIYPNPVKNKALITGDFDNGQVDVFDALGRLQASYSSVYDTLSLDCSSLAKGVYFIAVKEKEHTPMRFYKLSTL